MATTTARISLPGPFQGLRESLTEARYRARHKSLAVGLGTLSGAWHQVLNPKPRPSPESVRALLRRMDTLLERDLQNVRDGLYPRSLLFQMPVARYLAQAPENAAEFGRVWWRRRKHAHDDLPAPARDPAYPRYYTRTFHWQSDGWFSAESAARYDAGVEFLFGGTADIMRRQVVPAVLGATQGRATPRVLDIACGTGRFLHQLHAAHPKARLYGADLSPYYLQYAGDLLRHVPGLSLLCDNAESLPLRDGSFDAITSLFLFHELPKDVRRTVLREALRLLRPGGTLAVLDSAQLVESPDIAPFLEEFPNLYHEPYYRSYLRDPLEEAITECGFEGVRVERQFLSKLVVARKGR